MIYYRCVPLYTTYVLGEGFHLRTGFVGYDSNANSMTSALPLIYTHPLSLSKDDFYDNLKTKMI